MKWQPPKKRTKLIWAAVDLDGTLAETSGLPDFELLEPIDENVNKLHQLKFKGYKIAIHTARPSENYEMIESWLDYYRIPYDQIVTGKILAHIYVDDRAVHSDEEQWA